MRINISLEGDPAELALFCRAVGWSVPPVEEPLPEVPAPPVVDPIPTPEQPPLPAPEVPPVDPEAQPPVLPDEPGAVPFNIEGHVLCCIVKDNKPSLTQDNMTRQVISIAAAMGCTGWTGFLNEQEVLEHLENIDHPTVNLIKYGADRGLIFGADTVNAMLRVIPWTEEDERFKAYFDGLVKLGARFVIWNDVDGEEDGRRVYSPVAIAAGMGRIRAALKAAGAPKMPIVASLTAAAKPDFYRSEYGFDYVEMQTFGNLRELRGFMDDLFDVYALDAQDGYSVSQIQEARPYIVKGAAHALRLYAGFDYDGTDWRRMPEQVKEHTETIRRWREAHA